MTSEDRERRRGIAKKAEGVLTIAFDLRTGGGACRYQFIENKRFAKTKTNQPKNKAKGKLIYSGPHRRVLTDAQRGRDTKIDRNKLFESVVMGGTGRERMR